MIHILMSSEEEVTIAYSLGAEQRFFKGVIKEYDSEKGFVKVANDKQVTIFPISSIARIDVEKQKQSIEPVVRSF